MDENKQKGTHFAVAVVLRRNEVNGKSGRKVKALAASLSSTDRWTIIEGKLFVQDVGLNLVVEYDENKKSKLIGMIQGTVLFGTVAAFAAQLTYSEQVLTMSAVAEISLRKLFTSMDTNQSAEPVLTDQIDNTVDLMAGLKASFKSGKLQSYEIYVLSTPEFSITDSLVLKAVSFSVAHDRTKRSSPTMNLAGKMAIKTSAEPLISASSRNDNLTVSWAAQPVAPAKIANGLVDGGLDGADGKKTKPELPSQTGFGN